MENLTLEALCAVVTLLCTIIWAVVIRPLQVAISELKELISDIRNDMRESIIWKGIQNEVYG